MTISDAARPARSRRYHHGNLRAALLDAAEGILREDGIAGLKLRAISKRAGVSHTAADPHFGDLTGLLSELAAIGFERLLAAMADGGATPVEIARGYVAFARANPQLFLLMFRGELLDMQRAHLRDAAAAAFGALAQAGLADSDGADAPLALDTAGRLVAAWGLVHGIATLAIGGELTAIAARVTEAADLDALVEAALRSLSFAR